MRRHDFRIWKCIFGVSYRNHGDNLCTITHLRSSCRLDYLSSERNCGEEILCSFTNYSRFDGRRHWSESSSTFHTANHNIIYVIPANTNMVYLWPKLTALSCICYIFMRHWRHQIALFHELVWSTSGDQSPWWAPSTGHHIETEAEWPSFCRWHFEIQFLKWKYQISLKYIPQSLIDIMPALV